MTINSQLQIPCPKCHQSDQTILMEDLYFAIIQGDQGILNEFSLESKEAKKILREIKPPAMERLPIWLIGLNRVGDHSYFDSIIFPVIPSIIPEQFNPACHSGG